VSVSQILVILLRRSWIVTLALLTTVIVAGGVLLFVPGRYDATATASIDPGNLDPLSEGGGLGAIGLIQGNILSLVASERVAVDVVKRLNLTDNPAVQENFRKSPSFGRESIEEWMAAGLVRNVDPKFTLGTNVLAIKYKSGDPNQAALIANAFLAATIDGSVAMKAAEADQTAQWFAPQLDELRKELEDARTALQTFQSKANMVAPNATGGDRETTQYMAIADQLSGARAGLTALQTRLSSGSTDLSNDPSDPDLQILSGLKEKLSTAETDIVASKGVYGANNPKMVAQQTNLATLRKQIGDATDKMRAHLKERVALSEAQIASLEAEQEKAQKSLIAIQGQRDRLNQLQREVGFRADELSARQRTAEQAKLKSKLTFSDMTVLDKASPPVDPAFPKPFIVMPVGIAAGLGLGLILALLAEAADRRVRFPIDLEHAAPAPFLGALNSAGRVKPRIGASRRSLRPA
jgi:succinoglycan biosynthesis transport protein ExoP